MKDIKIMENGQSKSGDDRVSSLIAAVLRVGASLDVATVLQEAVDSACALTGARYGLIVTVDESGTVEESFFSGCTSEEQQSLVRWPNWPNVIELLRRRLDPGRIADLPTFLRSLGIDPRGLYSVSFQGVPIRDGETVIGHFFLAGEPGAQQFTDVDEELLLLFAAQAATAVVNARSHGAEQRARAHLEALIETSPVGVVVLGARTGLTESVNHEARRIGEGLRTPGRPIEELEGTVKVRLGDGREMSPREYFFERQLGAGKTVHAEEIEATVPDGRSASMLVNATPVLDGIGRVVSVVVTLQDLAPIKELDRQRAEFFGLVSHELRTPLAAIKGSTVSALADAPSLDPVEALEFLRVIDEQADHMRGLIGDLLDAGQIDAGTLSVVPARVEVAELVEQARKAFINGDHAHTILVDLPADLPRVLADARRIVQVLNNLFTNAALHSRSSAPIKVAAKRDGAHVAVSVADEGQGVSAEQLPHLFRRRYGARNTGRASGRSSGLGLAISKGLVEAHGGRIRAASGGLGQGTQFTFTIPAAVEPDTATFPAGDPPNPISEGVNRPPVLVVDDDPLTLRFVRDALAEAGYAPIVTGDHDRLGQIIETERPCLVLLDLMLAGSDGIKLLETVRELADQPVVFISAYGRDETIARALEHGAADYLVKPFSATELVARVRAALRRHAEPEPFALGELAIHYAERRVSVAGHTVRLTATEYELLRLLSTNAGRVLDYDTLIRRLWSKDDAGVPDRVRTFVKQVRRKLGDDPATPTWIFNERGVGYRMPRPNRE